MTHTPHILREKCIKAWVKIYRLQHPRSRIEHPYRISRNGGTKRVYESLVNKSTISMCARYPMTKRVFQWMNDQDDAAVESLKVY